MSCAGQGAAARYAAAYGETFKTILEALALPVKAGENYKNGRADLLEVKNIVETVRQLSEVWIH